MIERNLTFIVCGKTIVSRTTIARKDMVKRLFYACICYCSISNGSAEWTRFAQDKSGTTIYINRATLQRNDDHATLVVLFDYKAGQLVGTGSSRSTKTKIQYDCLGERLRVLSMSFYAGSMGLGKIIDTNPKRKQWEPVTHNSMGGSSFDYACDIFSADGAEHKYSQDEIPNWEQGQSTEDTDVFFDPKTINRSKDKVSMAVIVNFKMPIDMNSKLAWSVKAKTEFDCVKRSSRYSAVKYFDLPYGKGARVIDKETTQQSWKPISDQGLSMGMWNIACGS
jgi:hypothetical protein